MLIPQLRADGQRTEEPKTSPVRRKIRPGQRLVRFRNQRPPWIVLPPHGNVFWIRPERLWIGCTDECAESDREDSACLGQIRLSQVTLLRATSRRQSHRA